jgi:hypothetical protein
MRWLDWVSGDGRLKLYWFSIVVVGGGGGGGGGGAPPPPPHD